MNESDPPIDAEFETVSPDQSHLGLPFRAVWLVFVIISMVALALLATAFFGLKELNTPPALSADSQDTPTTAAEPPLSNDNGAPAPELARLNQQVEHMAMELDNMARLIETQSETVNSLLAQSQRLEALSANQDVLVTAINQLQNTSRMSATSPTGPASDPAISNSDDAAASDANAATSVSDPAAITPAVSPESTNQGRSIVATTPEAPLISAAQSDPQFDTLRGDLVDIRSQVEALSQKSSQSRLDQAALALMMIDSASARGTPFILGFQQLSIALPDDPDVAALAVFSDRSISTPDMLREEFRILKARTLDYQARNTRNEPGWMATLFGDSIRIRQTGPTALGARLDSVADALDADDFELAISNLGTLDTELRRPFDAWLEQARDRQKLDQILHQLRLTLISKGQP
ncbi:MAG: COG4223 family protein [Henriciella sp.]